MLRVTGTGTSSTATTDAILPALIVLLPNLQAIRVRVGSYYSLDALEEAVVARRRTLRSLTIKTAQEMWEAEAVLRMAAQLSNLRCLSISTLYQSSPLPDDVPLSPSVVALTLNLQHGKTADTALAILRRFPNLELLNIALDSFQLPVTAMAELVDAGAFQVETLTASCDNRGATGMNWSAHPPRTPDQLSKVRFLTWFGDPGLWWGYRCVGVEQLTLPNADAASLSRFDISSFPSLRDLVIGPLLEEEADAIEIVLRVRACLIQPLTRRSLSVKRIASTSSACERKTTRTRAYSGELSVPEAARDTPLSIRTPRIEDRGR